jgi:predicted Zn-dependent peptidase
MSSIKKLTLKNGLRIILVSQPQTMAASVLILVKAGSEYETKKINGVSHFLEHMMFKGTKNRPRSSQIAEELASLGAQSNAFTSKEYTGYWAKAEARKLPKILDIVSDLYLNPVFNPQEIEKERGVIIEELNMYQDSPKRHVGEIFDQLLYGDQPAGWDIVGDKKTIKSLTKDDFISYRHERYVMPGTLVVVAGNFNAKKVMTEIRRRFEHLPKRRASEKPKTIERQASPKTLIRFKDSKQSHLVVGFRAFDLFDKRRYAIQVLADVLGGSMSSRLFKRIREEMGAAYYVYADADLSLDHGVFSMSAGVDHTKIDAVIKTMIEECDRLRKVRVPDAELKRAKDHMLGNLALELETSDELASFYGSQEILSGKFLPLRKLVTMIKGVTAADVQHVAKDIFKNKGLNLAVIGPYKDAKRFTSILKF